MLASEFIQERTIAWSADKDRFSQVSGASVRQVFTSQWRLSDHKNSPAKRRPPDKGNA